MKGKTVDFHGVIVPSEIVEELRKRLQSIKQELADVSWIHCDSADHDIGIIIRSENGQTGSAVFDIVGSGKRPEYFTLGECTALNLPENKEENKEQDKTTEPEEAESYSWWIKLHFEDLLHLEENADPQTRSFVIPSSMTEGTDTTELARVLTKNEAKYQVVAPDKDGSIFVKLWKQISDEELTDIADELGF